MTPTDTPLLAGRLVTVDDALGPRRSRFFGEGFKRVTHRLDGIAVAPEPEEGGTVAAVAGLVLPANWSRKGVAEQPPHLSTIDAMVFAAQLAGLYLAHTHGLGGADRFRVRRMALRAGNRPQEDRLDRFAVRAEHLGTEPGDPAVSRFDCRIGALTAVLAVEHGGEAVPALPPGRYRNPAALSGPWNTAPFGASHHGRTQILSDVAVDMDALRADADLALAPGTADATMIDLFVAALQLGQVLLYRLDGIERAASNTLWMRRTVIEPAARPSGRFTTALENERRLDTAAGTWRSADVVAAHSGLALRCSVAHLLPAGG
ncbi:AvrD family protein [Glycomyces endophyticus]|uniref:AvrD family protein n=1 Tax=Glycomyces endophyticus TaxID=480996 RepID=A0ABP4SG30_9ACTN